MIRWLAFAAMVALVALAAPVAAAPVERLVVRGDACALDALAARVQALLGRDPFDADAAGAVRVELARDGGRVTARITFDDADGGHRGPRRVEAASCDALIGSIALVIAMGQPDDAAVPPTTAAPPPASPLAAPRDAPALALHAAAVPVRPVGSELDVTASGAAGVSTNGWDPQLVLGLRWRHARHSLALELRLGAPQARAVGPMGEIAVAMYSVGAVGCRHAGDLAVCAALEVGELRGSGAGLFEARDAATPLISGGARLGWEPALWRGLRAHLELGADVRATTSRFDVDHMPVWTSGRFQAWAGAGVIARFL